MDKLQKQLIDTYIRKREIATGDHSYGMFGDRGGIKPYEMLYMIKNGKANPEKINGNNISELLKYDPKLYKDKEVMQYSDRMSMGNISNLIQYRPEFIDVFDSSIIDELGSDSISYIIARNPELIDRFDTNKIKMNDIFKLLIKQPQLISRFEDKLKSFDNKKDNFSKGFFWNEFKGSMLRDENMQKKQYGIFLNAMVKYPQYREFFKDELKKDKYNVADLLERDYTLLDYFDLSILDEYSVIKILNAFPNLITRFSDEQLNSAKNYWSFYRLMNNRPELKKYFDKNG